MAIPDNSTAPIFELGRVEFPEGIPSPIVSTAICSNILAIAFANNQFYMLDLQKPEYIMKFEVPRKPVEATMRKIFLDPSGRHLLLNFAQGETWYIHRSWKKAKPLKRFNHSKLVIDAIAWNRAVSLSPNLSVTGQFLIGTSTGSIYEAYLDAEDDFFKSQERFFQPVFSLPEMLPIVGLGFEFFPPSDVKKCMVVAATSSRIYQFSGLYDMKSADGMESFGPIFARYKENDVCAYLVRLGASTT